MHHCLCFRMNNNKVEDSDDIITPYSIFESAATGNTPALKLLLQAKSNVNARDYDHRTALHIACCEGHVETASMLIAHGANMTVQDRCGNEPLKEAITYGHHEIAEILHRAGASLSKHGLESLEDELIHKAAKGELAS